MTRLNIRLFCAKNAKGLYEELKKDSFYKESLYIAGNTVLFTTVLGDEDWAGAVSAYTKKNDANVIFKGTASFGDMLKEYSSVFSDGVEHEEEPQTVPFGLSSKEDAEDIPEGGDRICA